MITPVERILLEERARRLGTLDAMAVFLASHSGKAMWLCKIWAQFIKLKYNLKINGNGT